MRLNDLDDKIYIHGVDLLPARFQAAFRMAFRLSGEFSFVDDDSSPTGGINLYIRGKRLPTEANTVVIGNKFYNKTSQYQILKGKVPTIKTFNDSVDLISNKDFIAKKIAGEKQAGQLINQLPDDESDYIFQPKVNIIEEYRVITYYMNGDYHVSGVYAKTGSNASFRNVARSAAGKAASKIAIKATKILGYGFSGADIALVGVENEEDLDLTESIIGKLASAGGQLMGSFSNSDSLLEDNHLVILECNSLPSMANPMILNDLVTSLKANAN